MTLDNTMTISNKRSSIRSLATLGLATLSLATLTLATSAAAQGSKSWTWNYGKTYGDSDAGVTVGARGSYAAKFTSSIKYLYGYFRYDQLSANASGYVYADLRLLGSRSRAGMFSMSLNANADVFRKTNGQFINHTCKSNGGMVLTVGNSVVWSGSLSTVFGKSANLQLRIASPTIYVPMPSGGVMRVKGNAYGRVNGFIAGVIDPCNAKVLVNGSLGVSGHGTVSVTAWDLIFNASVSASFYANDQRLSASLLTVQPANLGSTWGKTGSLRLYSGSMRGYIKLSAILPPIIPVSFTLVNWSKGSNIVTLL
jgi:hypothetical protein